MSTLYTRSGDTRFRDNRKAFLTGGKGLRVDRIRSKVNKGKKDKFEPSDQLAAALREAGVDSNVVKDPSYYSAGGR
jgi:hypothetical protein